MGHDKTATAFDYHFDELSASLGRRGFTPLPGRLVVFPRQHRFDRDAEAAGDVFVLALRPVPADDGAGR